MPRKPREKRIQDKLAKLYESTIDILLDNIESGSASASIIAASVKLLKDVGVLKKNDDNESVDIDLPFSGTDDDFDEE